MPELPPITHVPLFARCPDCDRPFRGATSWRPGTPAVRTHRCPWCGTTVRLHRQGLERDRG